MRVLVVDDDPDVRRLCGMNLAWDGHEIIEASGGAEGLALLMSEAPDALLLDVMMPNIDGYITKPFAPTDLTGALRVARTLGPDARKAEREARLRQLTEHVVT